MSLVSIYCKETKEKGRGVFSASMIDPETIIEQCPVILVSSLAEINLLACSTLHNYAFRWCDDKAIVVALGYGSLYNHSSCNNAVYKMRETENTIDIVSIKTIQPGEEITINYAASSNKDPKIWFKNRGINYLE